MGITNPQVVFAAKTVKNLVNRMKERRLRTLQVIVFKHLKKLGIHSMFFHKFLILRIDISR